MTKILIRATEEGLHLSREELEQAGFTSGSLFSLASLPSPREIQSQALAYTCWKLGDAIRIGQPELKDGEWKVPLVSPLEDVVIGYLFLTPEGEVIPEKAPTHEQLKEVFDAPRTTPAAA